MIESQDIVDDANESVEQKFEAKQPMLLCDPVTIQNPDDIPSTDGKYEKYSDGMHWVD